MKIKEILNETLTSPYKFTAEWKKLDAEGLKKRLGEEECILRAVWYSTSGDRFEWAAKRDKSEPLQWEIAFALYNKKQNQYPEFGMTNTGDEYKTFSTAIAVLRSFVETMGNHVSSIKMTASHHEGASRSQLYKRIINRMCPSNWSVSVTNGQLEDVFVIKRNAQ